VEKIDQDRLESEFWIAHQRVQAKPVEPIQIIKTPRKRIEFVPFSIREDA
jgi:hypothetical protein